MVAFMGYEFGMFPPGHTDADEARRADDVFATAHRRAVDAIKQHVPDVPVGLTVSMADYQAAEGGEAACAAARARPRTTSSTPRPATTSSACRPTRGC